MKESQQSSFKGDLSNLFQETILILYGTIKPILIYHGFGGKELGIIPEEKPPSRIHCVFDRAKHALKNIRAEKDIS